LPTLHQLKVENGVKLGRKPIKGKRIHLKELLIDQEQTWQTEIVNWYSGEKKTIEYLTFICLWSDKAIARTTPL